MLVVFYYLEKLVEVTYIALNHFQTSFKYYGRERKFAKTQIHFSETPTKNSHISHFWLETFWKLVWLHFWWEKVLCIKN